MQTYLVVFSLVLLGLSSNSFALGQLGHRLVCQLAYEQLKPAHQHEIDALLATLSSHETKRIKRSNHQAVGEPITFAESCTWADVIKNDKRYKRYKLWHFVNVTREQPAVTKDVCEKNCITRAIPFHANQLAYSTSDRERLEALMLLGHWLGDIHQPLHVSFRSDLGGNKIKVTPYAGQCDNLHWYWDHCLLLPANALPPKTNRQHKAVERDLYRELQKLLSQSADEINNVSNVLGWANESLSIVRSKRFNYCVISQSECSPISEQGIVINRKYHEHHQKVIKQQIVKAAIRLSQLLEDSLSRPVQ